jgi:hypothetical protein
MRKGKKALLIVAATLLTIATLAVLNFVRSRMEDNEQTVKSSAVRVINSGVRAA